jgi:hypothetical protein
MPFNLSFEGSKVDYKDSSNYQAIAGGNSVKFRFFVDYSKSFLLRTPSKKIHSVYRLGKYVFLSV